jgi:hypothetical protein
VDIASSESKRSEGLESADYLAGPVEVHDDDGGGDDVAVVAVVVAAALAVAMVDASAKGKRE